jgi:hypothetical protein
MQLSRRKFTRALALSSVAVPLARDVFAQANDGVSPEAIELGMRIINVKTSEKRAEGIREALKNTAQQVATLRAYPLKRDTQPALVLGVFDALVPGEN